MFEVRSLSNDERERNNFFALTFENSRVLIYLLFNEIQTMFGVFFFLRINFETQPTF